MTSTNSGWLAHKETQVGEQSGPSPNARRGHLCLAEITDYNDVKLPQTQYGFVDMVNMGPPDHRREWVEPTWTFCSEQTTADPQTHETDPTASLSARKSGWEKDPTAVNGLDSSLGSFVHIISPSSPADRDYPPSNVFDGLPSLRRLFGRPPPPVRSARTTAERRFVPSASPPISPFHKSNDWDDLEDPIPRPSSPESHSDAHVSRLATSQAPFTTTRSFECDKCGVERPARLLHSKDWLEKPFCEYFFDPKTARHNGELEKRWCLAGQHESLRGIHFDFSGSEGFSDCENGRNKPMCMALGEAGSIKYVFTGLGGGARNANKRKGANALGPLDDVDEGGSMSRPSKKSRA